MDGFITKEETLIQWIKKEKRILHIGDYNEILKVQTAAEVYDNVAINDVYHDLEFRVKPEIKYHYAILNEALELVDDPVKLIKDCSTISKTVILIEQKYDVPSMLKPEWKKPWLNTGLEWNLNLIFDYINSIYLMYHSIHICEIPAPENKDD